MFLSLFVLHIDAYERATLNLYCWITGFRQNSRRYHGDISFAEQRDFSQNYSKMSSVTKILKEISRVGSDKIYQLCKPIVTLMKIRLMDGNHCCKTTR
ncbi:hypothetical protein HanIR_Chr05g0245831 [Helianthus annuus]|nr:hypothetical protein HanIR_Chr05g0245831 [Helianthus annuus]